MKITRIQVYGRSKSVRSRTRSIGFEADLDDNESVESATMILQDQVDRALADWDRALEAIEAEKEADYLAKLADEPIRFAPGPDCATWKDCKNMGRCRAASLCP